MNNTPSCVNYRSLSLLAMVSLPISRECPLGPDGHLIHGVNSMLAFVSFLVHVAPTYKSCVSIVGGHLHGLVKDQTLARSASEAVSVVSVPLNICASAPLYV